LFINVSEKMRYCCVLDDDWKKVLGGQKKYKLEDLFCSRTYTSFIIIVGVAP
jgi:hypothetical protein